MRIQRWIWGGGCVAASVFLCWATHPPPDDLAFLSHWRPARETRIGDLQHPGNASYGTWTVLRFPSPKSLVFFERGSKEADRYAHLNPNIDTEIQKRLPLGEYRSGPHDFGCNSIDSFKDPNGGPDRYVYVSGVFRSDGEDAYQVWIKNDPWYLKAG